MSKNKELRCNNAPRLPAIAQKPKCGTRGAAPFVCYCINKKGPVSGADHGAF